MEDLLADAAGHLLERKGVEFLAKRNMAGSSEQQGLVGLSDYDLVQWATDADGEFNSAQMAAYGITLVAAAKPGDKVSRGFVRK
jgi:hypothetical protein